MLYMDENGRIRGPGGRFGKMEDYLLQLMYEAYEAEELERASRKRGKPVEIDDEDDFEAAAESLDEFPDYRMDAGEEVEWSVDYRSPGGSRRDLHLKLRIRVDRPMQAHTAMRLIERAAGSGTVPPSISLRWIDWSKGTHGHGRGGSAMGSQAQAALRKFVSAMGSPGVTTRFSLVRG